MKTKLTRALTLPAMALALALAAPSGVDAQAGEIPEPDQEELVQFTEAYLTVSQIRDGMEQQVAQAETPEEANALQQQANQEMVEALEDHGMTTERYTEIVTLVNQDEEIRAEFERLLEELTQQQLL